MLRILTHGIFVVLISTVATVAGAQEYAIKFDRPETVGEKYPISASGESKQSMNMDIPGFGPQKQEQAYKVQLDGMVEVQAIDDAGRSTKLACTVTKCLIDGKVLAQPGDVITGDSSAGAAGFFINGKPANTKEAEALALVLNLQNSKQKESDDAMFGTDKPQKAGSSWPINAAGVAASLAREGMPIKKENVKGTTRLVAVKKVDGVDALQLEADILMDPIQGAMPDGSQIESGKLTMHFTGLVPADPKGRMFEKTMKMDMQMKTKVSPPGGAPISADLNMSRSAQISHEKK